MADEFKYKAFISYSHSDEKWASWLHRALESYRPPKPIVGNETPMGKIPARLAPVFRDRDELPSATNLGELLTESLRRSATQVVICSPAAAKSHWVNEEILTFKRLGRSRRIFCLIVGGEPWASNTPGREDEECFPPALRYEIGDDGNLSDTFAEPIAADARPEGDGKPNAKLKLISGMLGVGFDALKQREATRRHRRMLMFSTVSLVGMAITSGLAVTAYIARNEAEEQRRIAEIEAETARQTTDFLVGLFAVSDPNEALGNTITAREIMDKGAARIETELADQPEIQATLMETMGIVYKSLALYPPAASLLESALEKRRELFGAEHPEVARSADQLGEVLKLTADYEDAEAMYRDALAMREKLLGEEHVDTASTLFQLADLLGRMGDYEAAEPLFRKALEVQRKLLGDDSVEVAKSLEGLSLNLYDQGRYAEALSLMRDSVALQRRLHKVPHTDLAEALNNLGFLLGVTGEYQESEKLFREALAMKRFLLGDSHTEIASGLNNIAFALYDQEKYDEAEVLYREAIAMLRDLLGNNHPDVAAGMNNLAFLLYDKGDRDGAKDMMRESTAIYRLAVGDEHPNVARGMANTAMWMMEDGDYVSAEPLLVETVRLRRKLLGNEHTDVASGLTLLASLLIETGRFEEASVSAAEARRICLAALAEDHWRTAGAAAAEGAALAAMGKLDEAEELLLAANDVLENDVGALPFFRANAQRWLAALRERRNTVDDAAKYDAAISAGNGD